MDVVAFEIRTATRTDAGDLLALWSNAGSVPTVTDSREALASLLDHDPEAVLVGVEGGRVVGSLIAAWDGWRGNFYRLAVYPDRRRRGLATALVREGERRLRARGAVRLTAIVADDEDEALAFWSAAGYEQQRQRERFVRVFPG
ncbi:MAG TPA: GNAT family N-acetyltransferase [Solirubrobacterales bacterium]|nr:GNAT family N-acetyltransferase [Solirubrobacterales bacterium]